jgi:hypothetical protein
MIMMGRVFLLVPALLLGGCASTNITGYSDPGYTSRTYASTTALAADYGLERASEIESDMCGKFEERGVRCMPFQSVFPPTRQYAPQAVHERLANNNIESIIVLSASGDVSSSRVFGSQTYGSASYYGGSASGQATTVGLTAYSRSSRARVVVIDADTTDTAWIGDANTNGQGMINVTDGAFDSSLVSETVETLMATPHFSSAGGE